MMMPIIMSASLSSSETNVQWRRLHRVRSLSLRARMGTQRPLYARPRPRRPCPLAGRAQSHKRTSARSVSLAASPCAVQRYAHLYSCATPPRTDSARAQCGAAERQWRSLYKNKGASGTLAMNNNNNEWSRVLDRSPGSIRPGAAPALH